MPTEEPLDFKNIRRVAHFPADRLEDLQQLECIHSLLEERKKLHARIDDLWTIFARRPRDYSIQNCCSPENIESLINKLKAEAYDKATGEKDAK